MYKEAKRMALIKCPECGKEFSDKAPTCPNCGCPTSEMTFDNVHQADGDSSQKPHVTQKISAIKIDEVNRMFQIHGTIPTNGRKTGIIGKSFKGLMAVSTMGMSVAAEKLIAGGKNKVGAAKWFPFSDLVSYDLLEDDALVTSGGVGQALVGGAVFGGFGAVAGAITGKRVQKKRIESLCIKVTLNNFDIPCILIPIVTKPIKTNSKEYRIAFEEAHKILSVLDVITHNQ